MPLISIRRVPPDGRATGSRMPPGWEAPRLSRSLMAARALAPTSSSRVFLRSSSSTTTNGSTTSCSSKRRTALGSARRTQVSRTTVRGTAVSWMATCLHVPPSPSPNQGLPPSGGDEPRDELGALEEIELAVGLRPSERLHHPPHLGGPQLVAMDLAGRERCAVEDHRGGNVVQAHDRLGGIDEERPSLRPQHPGHLGECRLQRRD